MESPSTVNSPRSSPPVLQHHDAAAVPPLFRHHLHAGKRRSKTSGSNNQNSNNLRAPPPSSRLRAAIFSHDEPTSNHAPPEEKRSCNHREIFTFSAPRASLEIASSSTKTCISNKQPWQPLLAVAPTVTSNVSEHHHREFFFPRARQPPLQQYHRVANSISAATAADRTR